jgi:hypothetical protein
MKGYQGHRNIRILMQREREKDTACLDLFNKLGMIWKDRSDSASKIRENPRDKPGTKSTRFLKQKIREF